MNILLDICMSLIGLFIALTVLIGLMCTFLMALAVLDYIFDTDMKKALCKHIPHWSFLYKLRKFMVNKSDELDIHIKESAKDYNGY